MQGWFKEIITTCPSHKIEKFTSKCPFWDILKLTPSPDTLLSLLKPARNVQAFSLNIPR